MPYYETFVQLHRSSWPLILGNCWDVASAKTLAAAGYNAVGFSSHALAASLGYEDGERLHFDLLLRVAKRTVEVLDIPFTVDMEGGYSRTIDGILANIDKLHDFGIAGINLEDTIAGPTRHLQTITDFSKIIEAIADHLSRNHRKLFLNIRTDGFLLGMPTALNETLSRIKAYENAGADGIFVPCITHRQDIESVVTATSLPINVMCMPALPDFNTLELLGVKRISMGPFLFSKTREYTEQLAKAVLAQQNFASII